MQEPVDSDLIESSASNGSDNQSEDKYRDIFASSEARRGLGQKAVRGGIVVMFGEIASSLLRIGSMAVLARLLVPEDFGLLAMVTALTVFAERFKDLGLGDATVQIREITHYQVSNLFWINLAVCAGIAILLASLSKAIAWFYDEPRLVGISLFLASTFLFSGLVIQHQAILRRQLRFGTLAFINLSSIVLSLLGAILFSYFGYGYWALVIREFSRAVFVVFGTWIVCPWRPSLPQRGAGIGHFLTFGKNVTGFNLVHFLSRSIDKILIGKLNGPFWLGVYTNAYQLIALPVAQIQFPVNTVALPALSALQTEPSKFRDYSEKMLHLLTFISMPIVAFLAIFADMIIGFLLGPQWTKAVPIFQVLAVGAFVEPVIHALGPVMVASGRTKEYFNLGIMNAFSLVCCMALGSYWRAIGVAVGHSIGVYLAFALCLVYGLRHTPIRILPLLRRLLLNSFCSLLTALALLCVRYVVGWSILLHWLPLFAIGGTLMYLGLWLLVPGGRRMMWNYWTYFKHSIPWMNR